MRKKFFAPENSGGGGGVGTSCPPFSTALSGLNGNGSFRDGRKTLFLIYSEIKLINLLLLTLKSS